MHDSAPCSAKNPALQGVQVPLRLGALPEPQGVQAAAYLEPAALMVPLGQGRHALRDAAKGAEEYVLTGHCEHAARLDQEPGPHCRQVDDAEDAEK